MMTRDSGARDFLPLRFGVVLRGASVLGRRPELSSTVDESRSPVARENKPH